MSSPDSNTRDIDKRLAHLDKPYEQLFAGTSMRTARILRRLTWVLLFAILVGLTWYAGMSHNNPFSRQAPVTLHTIYTKSSIIIAVTQDRHDIPHVYVYPARRHPNTAPDTLHIPFPAWRLCRLQGADPRLSVRQYTFVPSPDTVVLLQSNQGAPNLYRIPCAPGVTTPRATRSIRKSSPCHTGIRLDACGIRVDLCGPAPLADMTAQDHDDTLTRSVYTPDSVDTAFTPPPPQAGSGGMDIVIAPHRSVTAAIQLRNILRPYYVLYTPATPPGSLSARRKNILPLTKKTAAYAFTKKPGGIVVTRPSRF